MLAVARLSVLLRVVSEHFNQYFPLTYIGFSLKYKNLSFLKETV